MLYTTVLTALLASVASALVLPRHTHTTNATYYQGTSSDPSICGEVAVSTGTITAGDCNTAYTYSLTIQPLPHRDCTYVLWKGTQECNVDSSAPADFENFFLPAGGLPVCVATGVLDGGAHTFASGELQC